MKYICACLMLLVACVCSLQAAKPSGAFHSEIPTNIPVPQGWEDGTSGTDSGGEITR